MALTCDDCDFSIRGPTTRHLHCLVLDRSLRRHSPCKVSREGLISAVHSQEVEEQKIADLRARLAGLERERDAIWLRMYNLPEHKEREYDRLKEQRRSVSDRANALENEIYRRETALTTVNLPRAIQFLWSRTQALDASCPKCGFVRLDEEIGICPLDGALLEEAKRSA